MASRTERLIGLLDDWQSLRGCGPGDDPDELTAVTTSHRYVLVQIQRLAAPLLGEVDAADLKAIDIDVNDVYSVYNARAQLASLLPDLEDGIQRAKDGGAPASNGGWIVAPSLIDELRSACIGELDTALLVEMCREINSSFAGGNNIATVLLMRAVLNYVPPVFSHNTFAQVVASRGSSLKSSFGVLEEGLRKIADFHTHRRIGKSDRYPTRAQVEPFKPQFELLLQEVASSSPPS